MKIYSEVGSGTTVKLYLPRHVAASREAEAASRVPAVPRGRGETILVVEDDPDVRSFTIEMLRELGYQRARGDRRRKPRCACSMRIARSCCCSPMSACRAA